MDIHASNTLSDKDLSDNQLPEGFAAASSDDLSTRDKCLEVVEKIYSLGMRLDTFLDALCYGNTLCRPPHQLKTARRHLQTSDLLPGILDRLHAVPRTESKGKQAEGAAELLERWALATTARIYRQELLDFANEMKCDVEEIVNEEMLESLTFQSILDQALEHAPRLFGMLTSICQEKRQTGPKRTEKDPTFCVVNFISALLYQVSQLNNRTQMFFCVYLKAKGALKSINALLQHCGLSLTYNWAQNAVKTISKEAMLKAITAYEEFPCVFMYNNLRVPFPVKHQRSGNLSATDNGTAISIIPIHDEAAAILNNPAYFLEHRKHIKQLYIEGAMPSLSPSDLHRPLDNARVNRRLQYNILAALFRIPALKHLEVKSEPLLQPPEPVELLPHGPAHRSRQFMLGTVDIDESSLAGNDAVMKETLKQLKQTHPTQQRTLAESRLQVWVGDQLTVSRGEALADTKQPELNAFDRNDWAHWEPGWFHILMNLARSIYYVNFGTSTGLLLARDVATLGCSGLKSPTKQKGPEFHILDEALHHILEARYRGLWMWALGANDLAELVTKVECSTAQHLLDAAQWIWTERTSSRALVILNHAKTTTSAIVDWKTVRTTTNQDLALESVIRSTRNLMLYEETRRAVRFGDVRQMELLLPRLLFHFSGTGSGNYTRLLTSMLHWRTHEAPPGFAKVMRQCAWLVNFNGEEDGFYPIDLRQELNNLAIRVGDSNNDPSSITLTISSTAPWTPTPIKYLGAVLRALPAMPVLSSVIDQFDRQFSNFHHSRKHYVPDPEEDIAHLVQKQAAAAIHIFNPERQYSSSDVNIDPMEIGQQNILYSDYLADYAEQRSKYYRHASSLEVYSDQEFALADLVTKVAGINVDNNEDVDLEHPTVLNPSSASAKL